MKEYELLEMKEAHSLSIIVSERLDEGYELYGNPFAVVVHDEVDDEITILYCQAVYRYNPYQP